MRRITLALLLFACLLWTGGIILAEENAEDFLPVAAGMTLNFIHVVEHMDQKDSSWVVKVVKNSFPESLTFTWVKKDKKGSEITGTRILTDIQYSRNFNPWFKKEEGKATNDTAPWLSVQVLKDLQEGRKSEKFREGGAGAINWAPASLTVKEQILFPVLINGKAQALRALKLNKGLIVWNNLKNPLVLEYEPLGIPLFTGISGWKLVSIEY